MVAPIWVLNLFGILNTFVISRALGVYIQLFKDDKFSELLLESDSTAECNNIPRTKLADVYSIKTDTCFITYFNTDCKSPWSVKYLSGDVQLSENELTWIESFHICNETEGGKQLNVDIFTSDDSSATEVIQSYKNICTCINIPEHVQKMHKWSIDNHHNAMLAYYEPDCSETKLKPKILAAGHNLDSNFIHELQETDNVTEITYKIQSFGPDPDSFYVNASCPSKDVTTQSSKPYESVANSYQSTTERRTELNIDLNERYRVPNTYANTDLNEWYRVPNTYTNVDLIERYRVPDTYNNVDPNYRYNERETYTTVELNERLQKLSTQFKELETKVDKSTQSLDTFHSRFLKQHKEEFNKLAERITELRHGYRNFTEKIKSGLHEMLA